MIRNFVVYYVLVLKCKIKHLLATSAFMANTTRKENSHCFELEKPKVQKI